METLIVKNQAEWDALPEKFEKQTAVHVYSDPKIPIILKRSIENIYLELRENTIAELGGAIIVRVMWESAQVREMRESAQVGEMWGSAQVGVMWESAQVRVMRESAQVRVMRESAQVGVMWGSAQVGEMWESAQVREMRESAQVRVMRESAQVGVMWESAQVREMRGSAQVRVMRESAQVGEMRGSAQVGEMWESAQVRVMRGSAQVREMRGSAQVRVMRESAQVGEMWGSAQVGVMWESAQVRVMRESAQVGEMRGSAQVKAHENCSIRSLSDEAKIEAFHSVTIICQDCKPTIKRHGTGVTVVRTKTFRHSHKSFCEMYPPDKKGSLTLYKSVRPDTLCDHYTGNIKYEGIVECPDWDPNKDRQCGGGLHLSPTPEDALQYHGDGKVLVCKVAKRDFVVYPTDITKVRCRKVTVIREWKETICPPTAM